ncbi:polysaccharide deacetylase family protein [Congregibacter sp.]|uniref:polysaccharide deacetylase family protein n=1 Tax=Congregibacter sp. TaxID=2744308 RepID=UPI0039E56EC1
MFSCNVQEFEDLVEFIASNFRVLSMPDFCTMHRSGNVDDRCALITFDDGYLDNYELAMPILASRGLSATFFVSPAMIEGELPWWDRLAFWSKNSGRDQISIKGRTINLRGDSQQAIKQVLRAFKDDKSPVTEKLKIYEDLLQPQEVLPNTKLMMNWSQIADAHQLGFTIGSHTVSHPILAHLDSSEQKSELVRSKAIIEDKLNSEVNVVAFPVGGETSFSRTTVELAKQSGYEFAFSSIEKLNSWGSYNPHVMGRIGIDSGDIATLQYRLSRLSSSY